MFKGAIKASMTRCLRMVLQRHPRPHPHEGAFAHLSSRPVKSCRDSRAWLTQVMKPTTFFQMNSASAGAVLRITDLVTGISALKHAQSHGAVTLAFDRVSLSQPIKAFDMLRVESEVVSVGNSSMLVMCKGFHEDLHTGQLTPVMKSFVTYVAMGEDFRPTQASFRFRVCHRYLPTYVPTSMSSCHLLVAFWCCLCIVDLLTTGTAALAAKSAL